MKKICVLLFIWPLLYATVSAQWQQTMGPYSGAISCFTFDGIDIYIGTIDGVYKSVNNGSNWTPLNNGMQNIKVRTIEVNGLTILAGTSNGVYRSTNGGAGWAPSNTGLPSGTDVLHIQYKSSSLFLSSNNHGLYTSTDHGSSWSPVTGLAETETRALLVKGDSLWVGTPNGAFLSVNNGLSWVPMNSGLTLPVPPPMNIVAGVFTFYASGSTMYAGTGAGVYKSLNSGLSWIRCSNGLPDSYTGTYPIVTALTKNGTRLYAGVWNQGMFTSDNGGTSWDDRNPSMKRRCDKNFVSLETFGGRIYAGSEQNGGVQLTDDNGVTWVSSNTGLPNTTPVALITNGINVFAGTANTGLFSSPDEGNTWRWDTAGLTSIQIQDFTVAGPYIFAGTNGGGVFKSADSGNTWNSANSGLTNGAIYALSRDGNNIYAGTSNGGVFVSSDFGVSWNSISITTTSQIVDALAVSGSSIYAGTADGVYVSLNGGTTWQAPGTGIQGIAVGSLVISGSNVFAGSPNAGIFISVNSGSSWTAVNGGLGVPMILSMSASGNHLFAGTVAGIYTSSNNGASWSDVTFNMPHMPVGSLAVSGTKLFAGVDIKGVWQSQLSGIIGISEDFSSAYPAEISLWPNPVKEIANIDLQLKESSKVLILLLDASGKQLEMSVCDELKPGNHSIMLDMSKYASGIYIVNTSINDKSRSLILVKK